MLLMETNNAVHRVTVRLSESENARWRDAAHTRGMSLTGFLKVAVDEAVSSRSSRVMAARIAEELLPRLQEGLLVGGPAVPPRVFDRACLDADLHRPGVLCNGCGGSTYA
jgi:uncharacterized protein (DUF1778 family)